MSYEKEGVTMRAVWLVSEEPEEYPVDRQAAYSDPEREGEDTSIQVDRPAARHQAFAAMEDDDDFWEIPTRLAP